MLKPKKKIAKKELRQDALISTYAKLVQGYEEKKKLVRWVMIGIVVVVAGILIINTNRSANEARAAADLGKVFSYVDREDFETALNGVPERNIPGLISIVENYGGTPSGDLARYYAATSLFRLGRYEEALNYFEDFSGTGDFLKVARLSGLGACYEAMGNHASAAEQFERAALLVGTDAAVPENLFHAARNYAAAGQKEKAIELYRKLKEDHPNSTFGREADRFISQLSA
jgi:tetratricopeptide (TPR) repeat protein